MAWFAAALAPAWRAAAPSARPRATAAAAAAPPPPRVFAGRRRCAGGTIASGDAPAAAAGVDSVFAATAGNTIADEERLALRMRLGSDWREALAGASESVTVARELLVARGCLQPNTFQADAAAKLDQLPGSLARASDARCRWDAEQAELTRLAELAAEETRAERWKAAAWANEGWQTWFKGSPDTPGAPAVVGPACWLGVGRPPALELAGCYIHGTVGSGKSTLMDLFCLFGAAGWRVRRQHFHEFSMWLHRSLLGNPDEPEGPKKHVLARVADRVAQGIDILCLDEFAITNVADAAILRELLRLLSERHVAVVCTTNRPPEDLYRDGLHHDRYIPAIVEHFRQSFSVMPINGMDYREELWRDGAHPDVSTSPDIGTQPPPPVFFVGGSAESVMSSALADIVGNVPQMRSRTVKISWGRSFVVPGAGGGTARFHFDDLCRCALAAEDFLHLAQHFHTVFLHDIPRLALEEHNEARRFTNLVDVLYEHSVLLLCHCHVAFDEVLTSVEALWNATDETYDADRLGVHQAMYDDSPNFQLQIMELGSRDKYNELREKREAEERLTEAKRLRRLAAPDAAEGDTGSGWSAAPAGGDLSAPDQGVAGVMVAAVGSLQESGFAARRAVSRLKEMQTAAYLEAARQRRMAMECNVA